MRSILFLVRFLFGILSESISPLLLLLLVTNDSAGSLRSIDGVVYTAKLSLRAILWVLSVTDCTFEFLFFMKDFFKMKSLTTGH